MPALGGLTISARWPLPERVDEVDEPLAQVLRVRLEVDQLDRVDRRQVPEVRAAAGGVGVDAVDAVDADQAPELLALARRADGAGDAVADAEAEAAHLARRDVDVVGAGQQAVAAHEAVAVVHDVEDAEGIVQPGTLGLRLEDLVDEIVAAVRRGDVSISRPLTTSRSSLTDISRRSRMSRSLRSRAASSSATSSCSVTGRRLVVWGRRRGRRLRLGRWSGPFGMGWAHLEGWSPAPAIRRGKR